MGADYPQGIIEKEGMPHNTFYYKWEQDDEFYWQELERDFSLAYWMMKAMEVTAEGGYWVAPDDSEGTLAPGEILTVNVTFDAQYAEQGLQEAYAKVIANDPYTPRDSTLLSLYLNQAPIFRSVEGLNKVIETETTTYEIVLEDVDGDSFTANLAEAYPNTTFGSVMVIYMYCH